MEKEYTQKEIDELFSKIENADDDTCIAIFQEILNREQNWEMKSDSSTEWAKVEAKLKSIFQSLIKSWKVKLLFRIGVVPDFSSEYKYFASYQQDLIHCTSYTTPNPSSLKICVQLLIYFLNKLDYRGFDSLQEDLFEYLLCSEDLYFVEAIVSILEHSRRYTYGGHFTIHPVFEGFSSFLLATSPTVVITPYRADQCTFSLFPTFSPSSLPLTVSVPNHQGQLEYFTQTEQESLLCFYERIVTQFPYYSHLYTFKVNLWSHIRCHYYWREESQWQRIVKLRCTILETMLLHRSGDVISAFHRNEIITQCQQIVKQKWTSETLFYVPHCLKLFAALLKVEDEHSVALFSDASSCDSFFKLVIDYTKHCLEKKNCKEELDMLGLVFFRIGCTRTIRETLYQANVMDQFAMLFDTFSKQSVEKWNEGILFIWQLFNVIRNRFSEIHQFSFSMPFLSSVVSIFTSILALPTEQIIQVVSKPKFMDFFNTVFTCLENLLDDMEDLDRYYENCKMNWKLFDFLQFLLDHFLQLPEKLVEDSFEFFACFLRVQPEFALKFLPLEKFAQFIRSLPLDQIPSGNHFKSVAQLAGAYLYFEDYFSTVLKDWYIGFVEQVLQCPLETSFGYTHTLAACIADFVQRSIALEKNPEKIMNILSLLKEHSEEITNQLLTSSLACWTVNQFHNKIYLIILIVVQWTKRNPILQVLQRSENRKEFIECLATVLRIPQMEYGLGDFCYNFTDSFERISREVLGELIDNLVAKYIHHVNHSARDEWTLVKFQEYFAIARLGKIITGVDKIPIPMVSKLIPSLASIDCHVKYFICQIQWLQILEETPPKDHFELAAISAPLHNTKVNYLLRRISQLFSNIYHHFQDELNNEDCREECTDCFVGFVYTVLQQASSYPITNWSDINFFSSIVYRCYICLDGRYRNRPKYHTIETAMKKFAYFDLLIEQAQVYLQWMSQQWQTNYTILHNNALKYLINDKVYYINENCNRLVSFFVVSFTIVLGPDFNMTGVPKEWNNKEKQLKQATLKKQFKEKLFPFAMDLLNQIHHFRDFTTCFEDIIDMIGLMLRKEEIREAEEEEDDTETKVSELTDVSSEVPSVEEETDEEQMDPFVEVVEEELKQEAEFNASIRQSTSSSDELQTTSTAVELISREANSSATEDTSDSNATVQEVQKDSNSSSQPVVETKEEITDEFSLPLEQRELLIQKCKATLLPNLLLSSTWRHQESCIATLRKLQWIDIPFTVSFLEEYMTKQFPKELPPFSFSDVSLNTSTYYYIIVADQIINFVLQHQLEKPLFISQTAKIIFSFLKQHSTIPYLDDVFTLSMKLLTKTLFGYSTDELLSQQHISWNALKIYFSQHSLGVSAPELFEFILHHLQQPFPMHDLFMEWISFLKLVTQCYCFHSFEKCKQVIEAISKWDFHSCRYTSLFTHLQTILINLVMSKEEKIQQWKWKINHRLNNISVMNDQYETGEFLWDVDTYFTMIERTCATAFVTASVSEEEQVFLQPNEQIQLLFEYACKTVCDNQVNTNSVIPCYYYLMWIGFILCHYPNTMELFTTHYAKDMIILLGKQWIEWLPTCSSISDSNSSFDYFDTQTLQMENRHFATVSFFNVLLHFDSTKCQEVHTLLFDLWKTVLQSFDEKSSLSVLLGWMDVLQVYTCYSSNSALKRIVVVDQNLFVLLLQVLQQLVSLPPSFLQELSIDKLLQGITELIESIVYHSDLQTDTNTWKHVKNCLLFYSDNEIVQEMETEELVPSEFLEWTKQMKQSKIQFENQEHYKVGEECAIYNSHFMIESGKNGTGLNHLLVSQLIEQVKTEQVMIERESDEPIDTIITDTIESIIKQVEELLTHETVTDVSTAIQEKEQNRIANPSLLHLICFPIETLLQWASHNESYQSTVKSFLNGYTLLEWNIISLIQTCFKLIYFNNDTIIQQYSIELLQKIAVSTQGKQFMLTYPIFETKHVVQILLELFNTKEWMQKEILFILYQLIKKEEEEEEEDFSSHFDTQMDSLLSTVYDCEMKWKSFENVEKELEKNWNDWIPILIQQMKLSETNYTKQCFALLCMSCPSHCQFICEQFSIQLKQISKQFSYSLQEIQIFYHWMSNYEQFVKFMEKKFDINLYKKYLLEEHCFDRVWETMATKGLDMGIHSFAKLFETFCLFFSVFVNTTNANTSHELLSFMRVTPTPTNVQKEWHKIHNLLETCSEGLKTLFKEYPQQIQLHKIVLFLSHYPDYFDFDMKKLMFYAYLKNDQSVLDVLEERGDDFTVTVKRETLFKDSLEILKETDISDWKRNLSITFQNEPGVDYGGPKREWFLETCKCFFKPETQLFISAGGNNSLLQPNPQANDSELLSQFNACGLFVALALFNRILLDCYFTKSFYKHILGLPLSYKDFEMTDPEYYKNLAWLAENSLETVGIMDDMSFTLELPSGETIDLKENGSSINVNDENKLEYIRLVTEYKMTTIMKQQLEQFLEGFYKLIPKALIRLFNEQELELLISGIPEFDVNDLKNNTEYNGYTNQSMVIQWFWKCVEDMTREQKAQFLQFATGSSRIPVGGFAKLTSGSGNAIQRFNILHARTDDSQLPTAHTCFNQIELPEYKSEEDLRTKLLQAITYCYFGFEIA